MKPFRILGRNIRDAFKSVFRNFSLSLASITCIVITLVLVSIGLILSQNVNYFINDLESELTIVAYIKTEIVNEDIASLTSRIKEMDRVTEVVYSTKEEIKNEMIAEYPEFETIMNPWTEESNPLLNRYKIKVMDANDIKGVANKIKDMNMIDSVVYGERIVDQILPVFNVVKNVTVIIVLGLILVTTFLISNTIKLTIYARRNEIEIMRLVGTSNIVIKLPFLFEGLFLGVLGAILPIILSIYGYIMLYDNTNGYIFSNIFRLVKPNPFVFYLAGLLLGVGAVVGMLGSWRAARKYLKI